MFYICAPFESIQDLIYFSYLIIRSVNYYNSKKNIDIIRYIEIFAEIKIQLPITHTKKSTNGNTTYKGKGFLSFYHHYHHHYFLHSIVVVFLIVFFVSL